MIFLTQSEVPKYCTVDVISDAVISQANLMVNSYLGNIGKQQQKNERISLNRNNRGKLSKIKENIPLISIDEVKSVIRTPFGMSSDVLDTSGVYVDNYGYFEFYQETGINQMIFGGNYDSLQITYTYGYETPPEELKVACALIAQNIAKRGTFGAKSITDFDVQLQFLDDSIITSDIRMILNKYRGV